MINMESLARLLAVVTTLSRSVELIAVSFEGLNESWPFRLRSAQRRGRRAKRAAFAHRMRQARRAR